MCVFVLSDTYWDPFKWFPMLFCTSSWRLINQKYFILFQTLSHHVFFSPLSCCTFFFWEWNAQWETDLATWSLMAATWSADSCHKLITFRAMIWNLGCIQAFILNPLFFCQRREKIHLYLLSKKRYFKPRAFHWKVRVVWFSKQGNVLLLLLIEKCHYQGAFERWETSPYLTTND